MSSSLLVVEVQFDGKLADVEHLVSPSDSVLHLEVSSSGDFLSVESSAKGDLSTSNRFSHSLLGLFGVVVSDLSFLNFNLSKVDSNFKGLVGSLGVSLSLNSSFVHLLGEFLGLEEKLVLVSEHDEVKSESLLLMSDHLQPLVDVLGVDVKSNGELILVSLSGGNLPFSVEFVVLFLLVFVLVNGNLDGKFESSSALLVGEHLSVEFLVLGNSRSPDLDGMSSDVDSDLGGFVGRVVLFPGGGGEFLLYDNLSSERSGSESGGSSDLIEEDSSGDLDLGVLEVLGSSGFSDNSKSIELSVLGLGNLSFMHGFVGSGDELSGFTVEVISMLSVVSGFDVSGDLILAGFLSGLVSLDHDLVLLGDEDHGLSNNLLAVSNGKDHGLDGVLHLFDVSVTSFPFASGLSVGLFGKSDKVESLFLFLLVSVVSSNLSGDVDLGSLLSSDTEFLFSEGESGSSLGSFGENSSSGFHSGSGGVVFHGLSKGNLLSSNSLLVDDNPVKSQLVLDSSVSKVLLGSGSSLSSEFVPVGLLSLVEFGVGVVLLGLSIEFSNNLSVSDNLESENVRFLLSNEHVSVVSSIVSFSFNSKGNSLNRGGVSLVSVLDGVLGLDSPFLEGSERDLGVLLVLNLDVNVLNHKVVGNNELVAGDLDVLVVVSSQVNNNLGLLNESEVDTVVVSVELVKLGNLDLVPVDLLIVSFLSLLDLVHNFDNESFTMCGDISNSFFVFRVELGNDSFGGNDHLGVFNLEFVDHGKNVLGGMVSFLGLFNKGNSLGVGLSVFLVSDNSGGLGFLLKELVVDSILNSSLGRFDEVVVCQLKSLDLSNSNGGFLVSELDSGVCDSGVVSHLGSLVVEVESELFSVTLGFKGGIVLLLVKSSEVHGVFGRDLSLEESFLGLDGTVNSTSLVSLSLSLHVSLDLDLSSVHSLSDLASSDSVLGTDNSGGSLSDVDSSLGVLSLLSGDGKVGLGFGNTLELSSVLGLVLSSNSSELGSVGTFGLSNLALSLMDSSSGSLGSKGSSDFSLLDGDLFASLLGNSSGFLSNSVSVSVHSFSLSFDLEDGLSLGLSLVVDLLLEENLSLELSTDSPSLLEDNLGFGRHLTLEEDFSSEGSVSLGNEVRSSLSSLILLESNLLSLFSHGGDSLLTNVVGLGRAEPIVPLHSVPESTTIFASTVVVGLILVPVLVGKEGTVGPHPFSFLEEIVSANPDRGFGVNDRFDLILFSSGSDGSEMSSPGSAGFLSIRPVEFGVRDVLESGLGSNSLADEFFLGVARRVLPFSTGSIHGDTILIGVVIVSSLEVSKVEFFAG